MKVIKEDNEFIPENKLITPFDIDLPNFEVGQINKGSEVRYVIYTLKDCILLLLYYNHRKDMPFLFEKVPLIFDNKEEAIAQGFFFQ